MIPHDSLIFWKKRSHKIICMMNHSKLDNSDDVIVLYKSQDFIKSVRCEYDDDEDKYFLYVCDQLSHIKKFLLTLDQDNKMKITLENNFYVN